jgi:hypothetical protein
LILLLWAFWCGKLLEGKRITEGKRIAKGKLLKGKVWLKGLIESLHQELTQALEAKDPSLVCTYE